MLTILAFFLSILGNINWLMIGLLQYDFVAGIFGYQSSVFSRIIYIIIGAASVVLVFKLFKGKGDLYIFSKRNRKDLIKNINKIKTKDEEPASPAYNVEASEEPFQDLQDESQDKSGGLFDEHFDERG